MMAVRVNDRELVELLLRFGASVNFSVESDHLRYASDHIRYAINMSFNDSISSNESEVDPGENNIDVDLGESEGDFTANNDAPFNESDIDLYENEVNYGENNVYLDNDIDPDQDSVGSDEDGASSEGDVGRPFIEVTIPPTPPPTSPHLGYDSTGCWHHERRHRYDIIPAVQWSRPFRC
jgi:hypothetical protein